MNNTTISFTLPEWQPMDISMVTFTDIDEAFENALTSNTRYEARVRRMWEDPMPDGAFRSGGMSYHSNLLTRVLTIRLKQEMPLVELRKRAADFRAYKSMPDGPLVVELVPSMHMPLIKKGTYDLSTAEGVEGYMERCHKVQTSYLEKEALAWKAECTKCEYDFYGRKLHSDLMDKSGQLGIDELFLKTKSIHSIRNRRHEEHGFDTRLFFSNLHQIERDSAVKLAKMVWTILKLEEDYPDRQRMPKTVKRKAEFLRIPTSLDSFLRPAQKARFEVLQGLGYQMNKPDFWNAYSAMIDAQIEARKNPAIELPELDLGDLV